VTFALYPVDPPTLSLASVCVSVTVSSSSILIRVYGSVTVANMTDVDIDIMLLPEPQVGFDQVPLFFALVCIGK